MTGTTDRTGTAESTREAPEAGLRCERRDDGIAVITFDRPDRLNAINWPLYQRLVDSVEALGRDEAIRVVVLTGSGRAFCAGGDISFMEQMYTGEIDKARVQAAQVRFMNAQLGLPQPTIAAVSGPAIGLGCTIALSCDLVYAGERAVFANPHVQMGLVPGDGGTLIWPLLIGPARAKEFLFTADRLHAEEAYRLGLVNRVFPAEELLDRTMAMAARLAEGPAATIQAVKSLTNQTMRGQAEQYIRNGLALESLSQESDYHKRAVRTFLRGEPLRF